MLTLKSFFSDNISTTQSSSRPNFIVLECRLDGALFAKFSSSWREHIAERCNLSGIWGTFAFKSLFCSCFSKCRMQASSAQNSSRPILATSTHTLRKLWCECCLSSLGLPSTFSSDAYACTVVPSLDGHLDLTPRDATYTKRTFHECISCMRLPSHSRYRTRFLLISSAIAMSQGCTSRHCARHENRKRYDATLIRSVAYICVLYLRLDGLAMLACLREQLYSPDAAKGKQVRLQSVCGVSSILCSPESS